MQLVALHGAKRWSLIAHGLPTKGSKQCRRRWQNYLNNTDAKSGGWTADEVRAAAPPVGCALAHSWQLGGALEAWTRQGLRQRRTHLLRLRLTHGRWS